MGRKTLLRIEELNTQYSLSQFEDIMKKTFESIEQPMTAQFLGDINRMLLGIFNSKGIY